MLLVPGPEITAISCSESIGGTAPELISGIRGVDGPGSGVVLRAPSASCKACPNFNATEAIDCA